MNELQCRQGRGKGNGVFSVNHCLQIESAKFRQKFAHKVTCDFSFVKMTDTLTPPEGQTNFSGIPEAQFVEDVDSFMKGEENAEDKLKVRLLYYFSESI